MAKQEPIFLTQLDSPIGSLTIEASEKGLTEIRLPNTSTQRKTKNQATNLMLRDALAQLKAYFHGELKSFTLPLFPRGTDFQQRVWQQVQTVTYGETVSYAQIAKAIGKPTASRAVGMAVGRNPLPIVVPCHRIIGSNGSLTGFAGGLETKRWLLTHEAGRGGYF